MSIKATKTEVQLDRSVYLANTLKTEATIKAIIAGKK